MITSHGSISHSQDTYHRAGQVGSQELHVLVVRHRAVEGNQVLEVLHMAEGGSRVQRQGVPHMAEGGNRRLEVGLHKAGVDMHLLM